MIFTKKNSIKGALLYATGDTFAAFLTNDVSMTRIIGITIIGATLYAFEIPNVFIWIENKTNKFKGITLSLYKTLLTVLYFNPLWIFRHLVFIKLISDKPDQINLGLMHISIMSFVFNVPISFIANYIIQNKISMNNRFVASAIFSGLMAVYYAMSDVWFS